MLANIAALKKVRAVFRAAELSANLFVQPAKCVIIPVSRRCDPATVELVRTFLTENIPESHCSRRVATAPPLAPRCMPVRLSPWLIMSDKFASPHPQLVRLIFDFLLVFYIFLGPRCRPLS